MKNDSEITIYIPAAAFIYLPAFLACACFCGDRKYKLEVVEAKNDRSVDDATLRAVLAAKTGGKLALGIADPVQITGDKHRERGAEGVPAIKILAPIVSGLAIWKIWKRDCEGDKDSSFIFNKGLSTVAKFAHRKAIMANRICTENVEYGNELVMLEKMHGSVYTTNVETVLQARRRADVYEVKPVDPKENVVMSALFCHEDDLADNETRDEIIKFVKLLLHVKFMVKSSAAVSDMLLLFLREEENKGLSGDLCENIEVDRQKYYGEFVTKLTFLKDVREGGKRSSEKAKESRHNIEIYPRDLNISRRLWDRTCFYLDKKCRRQTYKHVDNSIVWWAEHDIACDVGISVTSLLYHYKMFRVIRDVNWGRFLRVTSVVSLVLMFFVAYIGITSDEAAKSIGFVAWIKETFFSSKKVQVFSWGLTTFVAAVAALTNVVPIIGVVKRCWGGGEND